MVPEALLSQESSYIVEVAVPCPLPGALSYLHTEAIPLGLRVEVPFQKRAMVGVVLRCTPYGEYPPPAYVLRPLLRVLDESPILSEPLLALADWVSRYYMHPIGEVCKAMLPGAQTAVTRTQVVLTAKGTKALGLASVETELWAGFFTKKSSYSQVTLRKKLLAVGTSLENLLDKKWVRLEKTARIKSTPRRPVKSGGRAEGEAAGAGAGGGAGQKGEAQSLEAPQREKRSKPQLHGEQSLAVDEIFAGTQSADTPQPTWLLHGVTGSGKTEVYLHLIEKMLRADGEKQALVLVPEISLTPQMISVFTARFGTQIAVVHSGLLPSARWKVLEAVRQGQYRVLIGPRSAVFAGFAALGLVIVDEEHDGSYKQGSQLLYQARDVAVLRGKLENIPVVLASATPSLESFYNAKIGKYRLLSLTQRANQLALPQITIVEKALESNSFMQNRTETLRGNDPVALLAPEITLALEETLARNEQAILIVNRRGYAHYLYDVTERAGVQCPNCHVSVTLHKNQQRLRCHHCDYATTLRHVTQSRPGHQLVAIGFGSQKVEEQLQAEFPQARIARLDSDVATTPEVLHGILEQFRNREIDFLVGTQMLAKGHDFPQVTLTVILELDQLLHLPDFRTGERTFQLMVQAAGRSGRGEQPGRVLIQTLRPDHPLLQTAAQQDYLAFAEQELQFRRIYRYPPFAKLAFIEYTSLDLSLLVAYSTQLATWIDNSWEAQFAALPTLKILGPVTPGIDKLCNRYRRTLLIRAESSRDIHAVAEFLLTQAPRLPKAIRMKVDIDPQSLL